MLRRRLLPLTAAVALTALPGCDLLLALFGCDYETDETCVDPARAQIRGTVRVPDAGGASSASVGQTPMGQQDLPPGLDLKAMAKLMVEHGRDGAAPRTVDVDARRRSLKQGPWDNTAASKDAPQERWREGEVIVRAHEPIRERKAEISRALELFLDDRFDVDVRLCGTQYRCLADVKTLDGKPTDLRTTARIAAVLHTMPMLKFAEKNLLLDKAAVFPSDEFYSFQWHYSAIDVPGAWDITTGDPDVVAAVIDTGILFGHPDLAGRVIGGADLIDDVGISNDGDGRDDDGDDAGDNSCGRGCHSHHGSHCAGTMGAATNNGLMVSGIAWEGGLLAVRVLGDGGGTLADIADGIEWSIGTAVDGVRTNARPADVINMSLGGAGTSQAMNEAVQNAVDSGAIVLVAAGNDNRDASAFTPANAPAAITVAALGYNFGSTPARASYSNFGDTIDVAAPGGEQAQDSDGDGNGDGVLSTIADFVGFYQGTSMATPHVAGVAMLMKSVNPNLTQAQALEVLQATADEDIRCSEGCGAGQINAHGAVQGASGGDVEGLSIASVRVGKGVTTATIVVRNFGETAANATFVIGGSERSSVTLDQTSATIPGKGKVSLTATIVRDADATDVGSATIRATAGDQSAEARLNWTADAGTVVQEVRVMPIKIDGDSLDPIIERLYTTTRLRDFEYNLFNLDPGTYLVLGTLDTNNNGSLDDPEDAFGILTRPANADEACPGGQCSRIVVVAGDELTGQDFLLAPGFTGGDDIGGNGDGAVGDGCASNNDCGSGLYCESGFTGGYCTGSCVDVDSDCPTGSTCFDVGGEAQICFKDCTADADCGRSGYVCDFVDGIGSCISQ